MSKVRFTDPRNTLCTRSGSDIYICVFTEQEDEEANTGSHLKLIVDAFIQQLPNCVNRDLIDKVRTVSNSHL